MRIFSNYKNMTTFEKLPEWVEVDSKWVIQCTREALNKLGDWCRKNAGSLAISVFATVGVNVALAQTTPTSPSASAIAPTDKGGWQVVRIDGKEMTFAEIAALPKEQKWPILKKLGELDQLWIYQEWRNSLSEAANQRVDTKKWVEQAANQTERQIDGNIQAANQLNEWKKEQLIGKYEQYISNIERWARWERKIVQEIAESTLSPNSLKERAMALLGKKELLLAGV